MATIYSLKPYVIPKLRGVPDTPMLEQGIREACRQFIVDTEIWTEINLMNSVAGEDEYQIVPDTAGTVCLRLIEVTLDDGNPIKGCILSESDLLTLPYETASAGTNNLSITIALKPDVATYTYPDWLYERYDDVMKNAVLYYFMSMPNKPWTDMEAAKKAENDYKREMHRVRTHKLTGRRQGQLRASIPISGGWF